MLVISYIQNMEVEYVVGIDTVSIFFGTIMTAESIQFRKAHLIYLESHKEEETLVWCG